ncbi:MAG: hypothetical protein K8F90_09155, partial [Hyphomicrobiales bacterium]|nr:hypothetical protein [Hyphomicrobiales bacterium]
HEIGQPQGQGQFVKRVAAARQTGKLGVGSRNNDNVSGRLTKVNGFLTIVDYPALRPKKMHVV